MNEHTVLLKKTIEYKKYFRALIPFFIIAIIYVVVIGLVCIYMINSMPLEYSSIFIITTVVLSSPFVIVFIYYIIKFIKKLNYLKSNYDRFLELEVILNNPIHIGFNKVKYLIKISLNGRNLEITSETYMEGDIEGNKMLIGFNKYDNSVIFLKNV